MPEVSRLLNISKEVRASTPDLLVALRALLYGSPDFMRGFHLSFQVAAVALFGGAVLVFVFVRGRQ